jgi:hypothetical protein
LGQARTGGRGSAHGRHLARSCRRTTAVLLVPPPPAPSIPASSRHHCLHHPLLRSSPALPMLPHPLLASAPPLLLLPCADGSRGWPKRCWPRAPASEGREPPRRRSRAPRVGKLRATGQWGSPQHRHQRPALPIRPHWGRGRPPGLATAPSPAARPAPLVA